MPLRRSEGHFPFGDAGYGKNLDFALKLEALGEIFNWSE